MKHKKARILWLTLLELAGRRRNLHFLHIGKTGGSAVKTALRDASDSTSFRVILHDHSVALSDIPKGQKVFFFMRDPASRFVSGFNSRRRQGQPLYRVPWNPEEKEAFERFHSPNELAEALSSPDPARKQAARHAMREIQHVGNPYSHWLGTESYFLSRLDDVLFVGRQERLEKDFARFSKRLGLPHTTQLPSDEAKAHRSPPEQPVEISPIAKYNLQAWYARDYGFLALCQRHAEEIAYQPVEGRH